EKEYSDYIREGVSVFSSYVNEWYSGNLQTLFFHEPENPEVKRQICSVLAGYVWDKTNPFVTKHNRLIRTVAHIIDLETQKSE
ncbi:MAG: pyridine nucleotide-disulfide oxidoreductase, partial [Arenibacter sp.]